MPSITGLATALGTNTLNQTRSSVIIIPLDVQDRIRRDDVAAFQYFPTTVSDQKGVNWQTKEIPGASLPLYQWISSGARTISFTAYFSSDVDLLSQANLPTRLKAGGQDDRNVDLRSAMAWLRQFLLPSYGQQSKLGSPTTFAPNKLYLYLQNSGIGMAGGASPFGGNDLIPCVMTQCDFDTTAYFPSGLPRVMTAQVSFAQIAQLNGVIGFPAGPTSQSATASSGTVGDPGATTGPTGSVSGPMEDYIAGVSTPSQSVPSGSSVPSQQPPMGGPFGYNIVPKLISQVISGASFG
jgi:hypothetical protein